MDFKFFYQVLGAQKLSQTPHVQKESLFVVITGTLAQFVVLERLLLEQEVAGSNPAAASY